MSSPAGEKIERHLAAIFQDVFEELLELRVSSEETLVEVPNKSGSCLRRCRSGHAGSEAKRFLFSQQSCRNLSRAIAGGAYRAALPQSTSLLAERCASYQPTQLVQAVQHEPVFFASLRSKQLYHPAHLAGLQDGQGRHSPQARAQCSNDPGGVLMGEKVFEPHRLSLCPDPARHTLTFLELRSQSHLLEADCIDLLGMPKSLEAQHLASAVDQPECANAPAEVPGDRLQHTRRCCLQGAGFLDCLGDGCLRCRHLLEQPLLRDVPYEAKNLGLILEAYSFGYRELNWELP